MSAVSKYFYPNTCVLPTLLELILIRKCGEASKVRVVYKIMCKHPWRSILVCLSDIHVINEPVLQANIAVSSSLTASTVHQCSQLAQKVPSSVLLHLSAASSSRVFLRLGFPWHSHPLSTMQRFLSAISLFNLSEYVKLAHLPLINRLPARTDISRELTVG